MGQEIDQSECGVAAGVICIEPSDGRETASRLPVNVNRNEWLGMVGNGWGNTLPPPPGRANAPSLHPDGRKRTRGIDQSMGKATSKAVGRRNTKGRAMEKKGKQAQAECDWQLKPEGRRNIRMIAYRRVSAPIHGVCGVVTCCHLFVFCFIYIHD